VYVGSRLSTELKVLPKLFSYPYGLGKAAAAYLRVNNILKSCKLGSVVAPLTTKWVYTMKSDGKGNILKHKANLVAREYFHAMGIDYDDSASPMTILKTVRFVLAVEADYVRKCTRWILRLHS